MNHLSPVRSRDIQLSEFKSNPILCLDVGDRGLAQALAGQFVPDTPDLNVSSLIHALYWGGAHEMRKAASELSVQGFELLNGRTKELGDAIALAVYTGNTSTSSWASRCDSASFFLSSCRGRSDGLKTLGLIAEELTGPPRSCVGNVSGE